MLLLGLASVVILMLALYLFTSQFRMATGEHEFSFPRDHGRQPEFQTEWWHLVGNLDSDGAGPWGYQLTIFRHRPALWFRKWAALRAPFDVYLSHMTVSNIAEGKSLMSMRLGSNLMKRADAVTGWLHVRVGDWEIIDTGEYVHLQALTDPCGISLKVFVHDPPLLFHGKGLIPESAYYYFIPSLYTEGSVKWNGNSWAVRGKSWLDREFGSRMVPEWLGGWDWLALMFNDNSSIVLFVCRSLDGKQLRKYCALQPAFGDPSHLEGDANFELRSLEYWTSPRTGVTYPVRWRAVIPSIDCLLNIEALLKDQERPSSRLTAHIDYWEGPVTTTGIIAQKALTGNGYVEMTGYGKPVASKF